MNPRADFTPTPAPAEPPPPGTRFTAYGWLTPADDFDDTNQNRSAWAAQDKLDGGRATISTRTSTTGGDTSVESGGNQRSTAAIELETALDRAERGLFGSHGRIARALGSRSGIVIGRVVGLIVAAVIVASIVGTVAAAWTPADCSLIDHGLHTITVCR